MVQLYSHNYGIVALRVNGKEVNRGNDSFLKKSDKKLHIKLELLLLWFCGLRVITIWLIQFP